LSHSNESTRDVIESQRNGVATSARFGIGTPTEIGLSVVHQASREIPDYGVPVIVGTKADPGRPLDVDPNSFYGFTDDGFDQNVNILGLRIEHRLSPTLTLRNQTQYGGAGIHAKPTRLESNLERNRLERHIDDSTLYNQTDAIAKFDSGTLKHTLVTGVEIGVDDYRNQGYNWTGESAVADPDHPVYEPMPSSATRAKSTLTQNRSKTLALYVNDTIELNAQWKLIGGVRWDRFSIDSDVLNNDTLVKTELERTDRMTSYRAGVLYQPDTDQSYYLSYGTSFNPSAETLTLSVANSTVEPEKNRSYEIGGKWELLNGGLSVTSSLFRVEKTNARETVLSEVELVGDQRVDGYEIGATGKLTSTWQVFAGYTHLNGNVVKSVATPENEGNVLNNTPTRTASLWSTALFNAWEVGGGLVYSSERMLNNANTALTEGYTRWDATFAYHQRKYDLRLNLQNLTDEEYFEVASGGRATPAQGRGVLGTLTYRF
jgi:catecholate siderophore receptor